MLFQRTGDCYATTKDTSPRQLGQGWETATTTKEPEALAVRIRSGTHLATGKMIGETKQPRAFVWIDEAANDPEREVVICPRPEEVTWLWGETGGRHPSMPPSRATRKYSAWPRSLLTGCSFSKSTGVRIDPSVLVLLGAVPDEGVALARKLQALVVEEAVVRYWRPAQDPRSNIEREIAL